MDPLYWLHALLNICKFECEILVSTALYLILVATVNHRYIFFKLWVNIGEDQMGAKF